MAIQVDLKKEIDESYDILLNDTPGKIISDFVSTKRILIVTDKNVYPLHFTNFVSQLNTDIKVSDIVIGAGENHKTLISVSEICKKLDELHFNRNDYLIALGGGVIGDVAGFAAAIYKRGVNLIQVPTTLLSMFDSSVGGKTGVNFENQKNLIGSFKQPRLVVIHPGYIETLPSIEVLSGFFEGVKHSLIDSPAHFEFLQSQYQNLFEEKIPLSDVSPIIEKSIQVKADIVKIDEKEQHERKFLNYGHTFGHALESVCKFEIPHGICVAYGMVYENILGCKLGYLSSGECHKINNFIYSILSKHQDNFKHEIVQDISFEEIHTKMCNDKKNTDIGIIFILLHSIGNPFIHEETDIKLLSSVFQETLIYLQNLKI